MATPNKGITVKAKYVAEVTVTDPDSNLPVEVSIYKAEGGGMVGIDGSFLANEVGEVFSPFDPNTRLELDDGVGE